ncbi:MAG: ribbon-helix-helix domain-containing protein [Planctomycetota bacterium]
MAGAERRPTVTLKIPKELYDKLSDLIANTGFRSVTEFVTYVLRDVAAGGKLDRKPPGLTEFEVEAVRQRLRALGYIE